MRLQEIRDIFLTMTSACRALEAARKHHENKDHGAAELLFNVALEEVKRVSAEQRIKALNSLDRILKSRKASK